MAFARLTKNEPEMGGFGRDLGGYAWLGAFVPALSYLVLTRTILSTPHRGGGGYALVADRVRPDPGPGAGGGSPEEARSRRAAALGEVFRLLAPAGDGPGSSCAGGYGGALRLSHPLEEVLSGPPLLSISSLVWVHDPELGRGYLLLSDSGRSGRIWRWEVGGGPITIGRSLHMEGSGCRSGIWEPCPDNDGPEAGGAGSAASATATADAGSAGLAVEIAKGAESDRAGRLVVAERGERRIVRIEEDGARTPLVAVVPSLCPGGGVARPSGGGGAAYSHFGDLLFTDSVACPGSARRGGLYRLREAVHVPPLPSRLSRAAHGWNSTAGPQGSESLGGAEGTEGSDIELLYAGLDRASDVVLGTDLNTLYVAGIMPDERAVVMKLPLDDDDDEDSGDDGRGNGKGGEATGGGNEEDGAEEKGEKRAKGLLDGRASLFHDLTDASTPPADWAGPALTVDDAGRVYVATPAGVTVLTEDGEVLGSLAIDEAGDKGEALTALELGDDGFLYVASPSSLMRVRVKAKPAHLPTDMVVPPKKKRPGGAAAAA